MNILRNAVPVVMRAAVGVAAAVSTQLALAEGLELSSPDVKVNEPIPAAHVYNGFGCTGKNISPALNWKNAPEGTKSFAVMVHDPDAPTGGAGFWHWVVLNLPASTKGLPAGAGTADGKGLPAGAKQITTDYGTPGWGGPCPPQGSEPHMYYFTVYALKVDKLDLPPNATASLAGFMINANALDKAVITAFYSR